MFNHLIQKVLLLLFFFIAATGAVGATSDSAGPETPPPNDCSAAVDSAGKLKRNGSSLSSLELDLSYRRVWQLVRDNTLYPERLSNWHLWEHKFDGKLKAERDLERGVNQMLRQLGDQYTYFRGIRETQTRTVGDCEQGVVTHQMLDDQYGYISIKTFSSKHVSSELQIALDALSNAKSYILDLRDNRGGYVDQALLCFSAMVDQGKFVSIQGRQDGMLYAEDVFVEAQDLVRLVNGVATREPRVNNKTGAKPIIVLVNDGTRSASEMLAGALRDVRRARLIGSKTFGKGVVQGTWRIDPGCSIKIAMARFYLPAGEGINGHGIRPDVAVDFEGDNGGGFPLEAVARR